MVCRLGVLVWREREREKKMGTNLCNVWPNLEEDNLLKVGKDLLQLLLVVE